MSTTMSLVTTFLTNVEERLKNMHFINVISLEDEEIVEIRSNLKTMDDISQWVEEFSLQSDTKWNVRSTKPVGERMVCRKVYECHHSSFNKIDRFKNKRPESKNAYCTASIKVKIKKKTYQTCRKDSYMKQGLWAVIVMTKEHTHTLGTPEALRFLPSNQEETFTKYFEDGMTVSQACRFHQGRLLIQQCSRKDLGNPRINPPRRAVYAWYHNWRLSKQQGPSSSVDNTDDVRIDPDRCQNKGRYEKKRRRSIEVVLIEVKSENINDEDCEDSLSQEEVEIFKMEETAWFTDTNQELDPNSENVEIVQPVDNQLTWTKNDRCIEEDLDEADAIFLRGETNELEDAD